MGDNKRCNKQKVKVDLPDKFNIEYVMVTDKLEIALNFNKCYVNIGKKLSNDIPTNSGDPLSYEGFRCKTHYIHFTSFEINVVL